MSKWFVGAVVAMTAVFGGCVEQNYVQKCEDKLRVDMNSAAFLKIVDAKWTKSARGVKVFIDFDAADAAGRMTRRSANCIFKGETLLALNIQAD